MKNIHLISTDEPSRLFKDAFGKYFISINIDQEQNHFKPQHLYITSDEEIKEGDYCISHLNVIDEGKIHNTQTIFNPKTKEDLIALQSCKKIILTTDQDLDGVQAIDDTFLEWFVKNPSCEFVEVIKDLFQVNQNNPVLNGSTALVKQHKIIIPQEEPKQNEMVGNQFYKSADKVISINKKYNMRHKTVLNISIEDKGNYKNIFKIKSKYYKLNNEEKEILLKELIFWARQEMNNLHPEQE